ncbi:FAD-dependent monooxygenase [Kordiimonas aquimaris]|uniref:FAD-dependent monooxygenase n=1 Tax=Kordiimonas aquimaris TaxID=707591 RepID=UPI0021D25045|nr:FAD-dependent monooxygenase [Kordiimonas aquimaris]
MTLRVLIAGGGIAGLTAALACVKAGFNVQVFERADALSEIGAGIQIGPNAARVMNAVGVGDALAKVSSVPDYQEMRLGQINQNIFRSKLGTYATQKYGAPYYLVHRADFIDVLGDVLNAKAPDALKLGKSVTGYENTANGVKLGFADGSYVAGDVLIGADGIHSTLREAMFGPEKPRFTGNVVWRAMLPATSELKRLIPNSMCIWVGPEKHCVTYWLRDGKTLNFVGAVERDGWTQESWVEPGPKQDFVADFGGWCEPISAVVDAAKDCTRWALFDRDPMPEWTDGNAALIGDACHPMLPFLAQGAAMGIEDAWVIVQSLARAGGNIPAALLRYKEMRHPRTSKVQNAARARMHSNHERSLLGQLKTYAPMWWTSRISPSRFDARYDWLYKTDVVAESVANFGEA